MHAAPASRRLDPGEARSASARTPIGLRRSGPPSPPRVAPVGRVALAACLLIVFLSTRTRCGVIEGPRRVGVDKSAVLKVPLELAGSQYSWQVAGDAPWVPGENKQDAFCILLDLPAGRHVVSFVSFDRQVHEVAVIESGESPDPAPPGPPPSPTPPEPAPDDRFGLARQVAGWLAEVPAPHRSASGRLADSFLSIASAVAAGTLREPASILAETRASNNRALGSAEAIEAWKPFGRRIETRLSELHKDRRLSTADDYRQAWSEIAHGLRGGR